MDRTETGIVTIQIGRRPRGETAVAARCPFGLPAVIRTAPRIDGEPFPTLYWLTCPAAARAVGALESAGFMSELNERLATDAAFRDAYVRAYERYVSERDSMGVLPGTPGAGGMPDRVKCLHALYAHEAATGMNPAGAVVRERIEPLDCPGPCVVDGRPAPGHPYMRSP